MSNGYSGYGYGYVEREKALEREKEQWQLYWTQKEEQLQVEQKQKEEDWRLEKKKFEEQKWKQTGELWQKAAQLNVREYEITKREKELAKREAGLDEETAKVLEQCKRAKKLERQSKRREERIQQQANEHFSVVYTTLQLGIKSLQPHTSYTSPFDSSPASSVLSPSRSSPSLSNAVPFRTSIPSSNNRSSFFVFGKVKAPQLFNTPAPVATTALSKRHSSCACTPTDQDEFDKKTTSISSVEAVNLVSPEQNPCQEPTFIDHGASLSTKVNAKLAKKTNGKLCTDDVIVTSLTIVCYIYTNRPSLPPERAPPGWFDKYNPHIDWGPLF
jgi:hypothetical protein